MNRNAIRTPPFAPDYAVPPGETLLETIEALGMDQKELATRLGVSEKYVSQLINGKASLSFEIAAHLELVTSVPARIWNALEATYRGHLTRLETTTPNREALAWLSRVPVKELIARGKIEATSDKATLLTRVLQFFGVSSPDTWQDLWLSPKAAFRRSACFEAMPEVTATWLRLGELDAIAVACAPYEPSQFRHALSEVRSLTASTQAHFELRMQKLCASAGVAVVFVPELRGCRASGAAWWLTPDKAVIALSLRYKTDDHLWFSFFHEAGHILNDPKRIGFVDDGAGRNDEHEVQANRFAADILIPRAHESELTALKSKAAVQAFAKRLGVSPGIVVGRLQHDHLIPFTHMNDLKVRLEWSDR